MGGLEQPITLLSELVAAVAGLLLVAILDQVPLAARAAQAAMVRHRLFLAAA